MEPAADAADWSALLALRDSGADALPAGPLSALFGPVLAARGLLLVGLDIIGDCLTEINVTSPTCFQEIFDQTGFDVAAMFIDALEAALATPPAR